MTTDELKRFGLEEMRDEQITAFLKTQSLGVLGLSDEGYPYLVPLSYGFDGDSTLYFTYLLGDESKKDRLTEATDRAPFLVYTADTMFSWESVLLVGRFEPVPPSDWGGIADALEDVWRPEIFKTANLSRNVKIYSFEILESSGIKHTSLSSQLK